MINESSKKNFKNKIKQQTNSISLKENDMESNSDVVSNEEQDDDFYNKDDFINEIDFDEKEIEGINVNDEKDLIKESEEYKLKVRKSGVIFISYIPEGLTVSLIRKRLENYGVKRIYLKPLSGKKNHFKEGWIEFENKLMAKLCEYELNGRPIGGKKREALSSELWTFKYLHKFKWHHLVEKLQLQQKIKQQEVKTAINQAHRENQFILESYQQSHNKRKKLEHNPESNNNEEIADKVRNKTKQIKSILKK